jgi:hypothetical protein
LVIIKYFIRNFNSYLYCVTLNYLKESIKYLLRWPGEQFASFSFKQSQLSFTRKIFKSYRDTEPE